MKEIYIVLTHTGTILSRIIKDFTKDEFSHVSISLDIELKNMYSFGRLNPYNPFFGGFVHEFIDKGTFKRFKNTKSKVFALMITDEQYEKVEENIKKIEMEKNKYKFNIFGLFAAGFHKKIGKQYSFYCAEFVKYILEESNIKLDLPRVVKPEDFKTIEELQVIYTGLLREYPSSKVKLLDVLKDVILRMEAKSTSFLRP